MSRKTLTAANCCMELSCTWGFTVYLLSLLLVVVVDVLVMLITVLLPF